MTEDHFVIGNTPNNLRLGLDIAGNNIDPWQVTDPALNLASPEIMTDASNTSTAFMYDFVEAPLN